jgi:transposase
VVPRLRPLGVPQLRHDRLVEQAVRVETLALLDVLNAVCQSIERLADAFRQHPDYAIITSFPGLADISGASVLAEIGDDRSRLPTPACSDPSPARRRSPVPTPQGR